MTHRRGILWTSYEHTILALLYKQRQHLGAEYAMFFFVPNPTDATLYTLLSSMMAQRLQEGDSRT